MASYRKTPIVPLETKRLRLLPIQASDAARIQLLFPNPNVLRYMAAAIPWPYPENGAMDFIQSVLPKMEAEEEYHWSIRLKENDEGLIGVITLTPDSDEDQRGFWLAEPFWGQGLMKEAAAAVTDFAFDVLEMDELLFNNAEQNIASHRLKESAGAKIVEIKPTSYVGGEFPGVTWRLTAEAWRSHR